MPTMEGLFVLPIKIISECASIGDHRYQAALLAIESFPIVERGWSSRCARSEFATHRLTFLPLSLLHTPSTAHISSSTLLYQESTIRLSCPKRTKAIRCQCHHAPRLAEFLLGTFWALLASCCLQLLLRKLYKVYSAIAASLAMLRHALERIITWQARRYYVKWANDHATLQYSPSRAILLSLGCPSATQRGSAFVRCECRYLWMIFRYLALRAQHGWCSRPTLV
jgi:hypothetical protein